MKKKLVKLILCALISSLSLVSVSAYTGRKIISKTIADTMIWSIYTFEYSFNATAVLTCSNDVITQISNLSITEPYITTTIGPAAALTVVPRQVSKSYSNNKATYKITATRTAMGSYTDKIDYTLIYKTSEGTPYSVKDECIDGVLVSVEISEPYDIKIIEE